jgi:hypothetical protein
MIPPNELYIHFDICQLESGNVDSHRYHYLKNLNKKGQQKPPTIFIYE